MAYAQELKNLVAEIKTGHKDRTARISEIKRETGDILAEADDYIKRVAGELKEMAKNLKSFLAKSEEGRKKDFDAMLKVIQAKIREIQGDVKNFLAESEEKRIADFKATMKNVTGRVDEIKEDVKGMLVDYKAERKEVAGYLGSLRGKEVMMREGVGEERAPSAPKRKRGSKE